MKVRFIRDVMQENPAWDRSSAGKLGDKYSVPQYLPTPKGTVFEAPEAHMLVVLGLAVAEDDECRQKIQDMGVTDQDILDAQANQDAFQGLGEAVYEGDDE